MDKELNKQEIKNILGASKRNFEESFSELYTLMLTLPVLDVAEILNGLGQWELKKILNLVQSRDTGLYDQISCYIFLFKDFANLSKYNLEKLIRSIDPMILRVALYGDDYETVKIREVFQGSMSRRAVLDFNEGLSISDSFSNYEIEEARTRIINIFIELESNGTIVV